MSPSTVRKKSFSVPVRTTPPPVFDKLQLKGAIPLLKFTIITPELGSSTQANPEKLATPNNGKPGDIVYSPVMVSGVGVVESVTTIR